MHGRSLHKFDTFHSIEKTGLQVANSSNHPCRTLSMVAVCEVNMEVPSTAALDTDPVSGHRQHGPSLQQPQLENKLANFIPFYFSR